MGSSPAPEIKVKITGEDTGVSAAIKELGAQLQQLKRTQDDASSSARRLGEAEEGAGRSMREAREGARLLSEETGVHLSRGLATIVSKSSLLGPLLNAAFPIAAAIGFGEVIASAAEKFSTLIANTFIYTDAMKAAYAVQLSVNADIAKRAEDNKKLAEEAALFGLKGSARDIAEIQRKGDAIKKVQDEITAFENKRGAARLGLPNAAGGTSTFTDTDQANLGNAQSKLANLQNLQHADEQKAMADKAEEDKTAADKAKTLKDQIDKARLAQIEAGFGYELALFKAQHSKADQDNEANYEKGLESTATYYERKRELALAASQKEIDALTAERSRVMAAPTKDEPGKIEQQTKAADLASKIAIAKVNSEKEQQQLANEGAQKQEEENRKALDWQAKIAAAQGLRFDEASERIAAEALQMAADLKKAGLSPADVDAQVAKFKAASTQQAQFAGAKSGGQDAIADLSSQEEDLRLKNIAVVAEAKIAELERSRIPILQAMAAEMTKAAVGADQIKAAADFAKSVDKIAVAAKNSTVSMQSFENSASQAIQGDLTTFLGSTIDHVHGIGDAFSQLAQSAVSSIQKIVAQLLVQLLVQKLVKAAEAGGFSVGGLVPGHAAGGLILGPGTGTSDSIPARLSTGEFVMRAAAVQDIGVDRLTMMNRGVHVPAIRGLHSIPRFAEGGLVQTGTRSDGVDVNMNLGLDEGLILKHLSSKAAGKIVLQHIGKNPKAVSKALTRGT
jgi:hypothetical protein